MLIQFTTGNFRSFLDPKILSMEATSITDFPENLYKSKRLKLNKCAGIYGANSSGKSNFLQAMGTMKDTLFESFEQSSASSLSYDPFSLKVNNKEPSFFEAVFMINDTKYRYGFEIDDQTIHGEWLFETEKIKENPLFIRVKDGIQVFKHFKEGVGLEDKTRLNALFLAVVDQFNGEKSKKILEWFKQLNVIDGISHNNYRGVTFKMLENEETKIPLTEFFHDLDLGFESIKVTKELFDANKMLPGLPEDIVKKIVTDMEGETVINLTSLHKTFDDNFEFISTMKEFNVRRQESSGTNKIIDLSGPIFDTLNSGGVLVIDELDAKFHPLLTLSVLRLFQSEKTNKNNAQLIFATHNTNILGLGRLRRDQIYFTEKDKFGITDLYSLVEYNMKGKKVRKDNTFEKDYIKGKYGAIPNIGDLNNLEIKWQE